MSKKFYVLIAGLLLISGCNSKEGTIKEETIDIENEKVEITYEDWNELAEDFDNNREGTLTIELIGVSEGEEFSNRVITYSPGQYTLVERLEGREGSYECTLEINGNIYNSTIISASGSYDEKTAKDSCTLDYVNTTFDHIDFSATEIHEFTRERPEFKIIEEAYSDGGDFLLYYVEAKTENFDNAVYQYSIYKDEYKVVIEMEFDGIHTAYYLYEWN